jgi:hypothetical protein
MDYERALIAVEEMNKRNLDNLEEARKVEEALYQIFSHQELEVTYNPDLSVLKVVLRRNGKNQFKNVAAVLARALPSPPVYKGRKFHLPESVDSDAMLTRFPRGLVVFVEQRGEKEQ